MISNFYSSLRYMIKISSVNFWACTLYLCHSIPTHCSLLLTTSVSQTSDCPQTCYRAGHAQTTMSRNLFACSNVQTRLFWHVAKLVRSNISCTLHNTFVRIVWTSLCTAKKTFQSSTCTDNLYNTPCTYAIISLLCQGLTFVKTKANKSKRKIINKA